ncbi:ABC transporter substrate-binding protein [Fulvivirga sp. M361]|uniref:ABC transporter substrate-binding protein n=1 Tax=Fulvivirga sp. M361 TaxID=2594266 RepID=UPI00117AFCEE|nr:ABC transporter substrate-binding protein [Fulvivirga sp. M361]TRX48927.1 ABC transporter substrate-binding protein [Fulvivirga sp. M361]
MKEMKLALDWTPNTNHTGFYVARSKGMYRNHGIDLEIISPEEDDYSVTPVKKLELGQVDFAIAPSESVISLNTKARPAAARAIAAIFEEDLSAIVALSSSGIERPADLDGKIYASYQARYEDTIVKHMIINDGGKGDVNIDYPKKLGIWDTLLAKKADATWIFLNWEGIEAKGKGVSLNKFKMDDFNIPYGYSPVIVALDENIKGQEKDIRNFLKATKEGFLYAKEHPEQSSSILSPYISKRDLDNIDLMASQKYTSRHYGGSSTWGVMRKERIVQFCQWLNKNQLETSEIPMNELFTNDLLEN